MIKNYSKTEVLGFLKSVSIMSVAINYQDKPISSVLLFHVDDDLNFYFVTHQSSYKAKALMTKPLISLSVWAHHKMLVQADGQAEIITDRETAAIALDKIMSAIDNIKGFWPPVLRTGGKDYVVFKITTSWVRVLDLTNDTISAEEMPFTEIKKSK